MYGNHDNLPSNNNNQDHYYPHDHVLGPGEVSDCFDPTFIPAGAVGPWDCRVGTGQAGQRVLYEEDQDQTHCDADLTGDDCPGLNDQTNWPTLILAPPSLSVSSFLVPGMDNASNDNGDDYATVVLSFSLE